MATPEALFNEAVKLAKNGQYQQAVAKANEAVDAAPDYDTILQWLKNEVCNQHVTLDDEERQSMLKALEGYVEEVPSHYWEDARFCLDILKMGIDPDDISEDLWRDKEFCMAAAGDNNYLQYCIPEDVLLSDDTLLELMVKASEGDSGSFSDAVWQKAQENGIDEDDCHADIDEQLPYWIGLVLQRHSGGGIFSSGSSSDIDDDLDDDLDDDELDNAAPAANINAAQALAMVQEDGNTISNVPPNLLTQELCLAAVKQIYTALHWIPEQFRTRDVCITAAARGRYFGATSLKEVLKYVPKALKDEVKAAAESSEYDIKALHEKGIAARDAGQYDNALAFFDKVIDLDPANPTTLSARAWTYFLRGSGAADYQKALADMDKAIPQAPDTKIRKDRENRRAQILEKLNAAQSGGKNAPKPAAVPAAAEGQTCAKCGKPLKSGAKFCPECGAKVEPPKPKQKFCSECGAKLEAGVKFCPECGAKV